ncbi:hypothetical protein M8J75_003632 [Diaphorina citri]|nr:hypothetical protein M8J75_003632 [Diaphorina citri]
MPRNYKTPAGSVQYKKQDPGLIEKAVEYQKETGKPFRQVAQKFGINYSVLYRHIKKKNVRKIGGQTVLTSAEESLIATNLAKCAEWGYPLDLFDLRLIVKSYLDRGGQVVKRFKNNMPGRDFALSFMKRHEKDLASRLCQNIKRARASVSPEVIDEYFQNLRPTLEGVPHSNIINYDETNLSDDPGKSRLIFKRGCKYPERIMNNSKSSTSIMFAASADGTVLPPYTVYKSVHLYQSWTQGGPPKARYNRTKSGWFDSICFDDWIEELVIPHCKKLVGRKILICDNLSSHLSVQSIKLCAENNIEFVFLPRNSTHLTQPLDIAFFRPLKTAWRQILVDWKKGAGRNDCSVRKDMFPILLKKLITAIDMNSASNVKAGFKKAGIVPIDPNQVLNRLPNNVTTTDQDNLETTLNMNNSFEELLKQMRYNDNNSSTRKRANNKCKVQAGKSVSPEDLSPESEMNPDDPEPLSESPEPLPESPEPLPVNPSNELGFISSDEITPVNCQAEVQIDDWVLVYFDQECSHKTKKRGFICQVIGTADSNTLVGNFLRPKTTRDHKGFIYGFPNVIDKAKFSFSQIVGKLKPPKPYGRGLFLFELNSKDI